MHATAGTAGWYYQNLAARRGPARTFRISPNGGQAEALPKQAQSAEVWYTKKNGKQFARFAISRRKLRLSYSVIPRGDTPCDCAFAS
jgi:hypothetical protein